MSFTHDNTRNNALAAAAPHFASRRGRILQLLQERGPSTLFEIAAAMSLHDHQISGRFTELLADGLITRTGQRRPKPDTGCDADVYALADRQPPIDLGDALHHPTSLKIGDEGIFDRLPWTGHEATGGIPYARAGTAAGHGLPRIIYRVVLIECDHCGHPLRLKQEGKAKTYACPRCGRSYKLMLVAEPGKSEMLALVLTHL